MLRLGNIDYSNCYPIHGPLLEEDRPAWLRVVDGSPSDLNRRLAAAELDVAPGSSIELARHSREYAALGGLCIGSAGPVESIVVESRVPLTELDGRTVALPTASASSRCLLRILLELRLEMEPRWIDFHQEREDPLHPAPGEERPPADATLFIGDVALRRATDDVRHRYDLGAEWTAWTGLPFVYALWLVRRDCLGLDETGELHRLLLARRDLLPGDFERLAGRAGDRFGISPARLVAYWSRIGYTLDGDALSGLHRFLDLASRLGEAPAAPDVQIVPDPGD